jgi:hypothetical protein
MSHQGETAWVSVNLRLCHARHLLGHEVVRQLHLHHGHRVQAWILLIYFGCNLQSVQLIRRPFIQLTKCPTKICQNKKMLIVQSVFCQFSTLSLTFFVEEES